MSGHLSPTWLPRDRRFLKVTFQIRKRSMGKLRESICKVCRLEVTGPKSLPWLAQERHTTVVQVSGHIPGQQHNPWATFPLSAHVEQKTGSAYSGRGVHPQSMLLSPSGQPYWILLQAKILSPFSCNRVTAYAWLGIQAVSGDNPSGYTPICTLTYTYIGPRIIYMLFMWENKGQEK